MPQIIVRDMTGADEYFVSTCSHVNESDETDACGRRRLAWLQGMHADGLRTKVALLDGEHAGFLYAMPIEICPTMLLGRDLLMFPCLWVIQEAKSKGVGEALVVEVELEARRQHKKGVATMGHYGDFWFMPAAYFEKHGYSAILRDGNKAALWKVFDESAEPPEFMEPTHEFAPGPVPVPGPGPGRVVVDLFWFTFCQTVDIEAQRVREVVSEFGDAVTLNEYCADDREILLRYQRPRGIFINGKEIGWGYEAPKDGIRNAIVEAMEKLQG